MKRLTPLAFILPILAACTPQQTNNAASCAASLAAVPARNAADLFMVAQQSPVCVAAGIDLMQEGVDDGDGKARDSVRLWRRH